MDDLPAPIRDHVNRPFRLGVTGIIVSLVFNAAAYVLGSPLLVAAASFTFLIGFIAFACWLYRVSQVPRLLSAHQAEVERRERAQRRQQDDLLRWQEQRKAREEATERCRIAAFEAVLLLAPGEQTILETSAGRIWAQRCTNGSLRLWWAFNTMVRELAVPIVRRRARYVGDNPVAWFVDRQHERGVLLDLSRI